MNLSDEKMLVRVQNINPHRIHLRKLCLKYGRYYVHYNNKINN